MSEAFYLFYPQISTGLDKLANLPAHLTSKLLLDYINATTSEQRTIVAETLLKELELQDFNDEYADLMSASGFRWNATMQDLSNASRQGFRGNQKKDYSNVCALLTFCYITMRDFKDSVTTNTSFVAVSLDRDVRQVVRDAYSSLVDSPFAVLGSPLSSKAAVKTLVTNCRNILSDPERRGNGMFNYEVFTLYAEGNSGAWINYQVPYETQQLLFGLWDKSYAEITSFVTSDKNKLALQIKMADLFRCLICMLWSRIPNLIPQNLAERNTLFEGQPSMTLYTILSEETTKAIRTKTFDDSVAFGAVTSKNTSNTAKRQSSNSSRGADSSESVERETTSKNTSNTAKGQSSNSSRGADSSVGVEQEATSENTSNTEDTTSSSTNETPMFVSSPSNDNSSNLVIMGIVGAALLTGVILFIKKKSAKPKKKKN